MIAGIEDVPLDVRVRSVLAYIGANISDAYLHRNGDTGEIELNIELHNLSADEENMALMTLPEIDSVAYWE